MFFDAEQTLEALQQTEIANRKSWPVQSGAGKSNLVRGVLIGILIGRGTK